MNQEVSSSMDMNAVIAKNLRTIRTRESISLGDLAQMTGVSKSMLGQIERGESSPTISTLWKIATGLNVSFTDLMEHQQSGVQIIHESDMTPAIGDDGRFQLFPLVSSHTGKRADVMDLILEPDASSTSSPHAPGTEEYVYVYQGELTVTLGGKDPEEYIISAGSMIHFAADTIHSYANRGNSETRAVNVIFYA